MVRGIVFAFINVRTFYWGNKCSIIQLLKLTLDIFLRFSIDYQKVDYRSHILDHCLISFLFIMSNAKIPMTCICPNSKCHAQCILSLDNVLGSLAENNVPKIMSIRKYTMVCLLRAWFIGGRIIVAWKLMHGPHFIAPIFSAKYTLCFYHWW